MRVVEALSDGAPSSVTESTRLIVQSINQHNEALFRINQQIHENPELGYEEVKAHDNICSMLESLGYTVQRHTYGLQTSFMAEYGSGGRVVAFNAEYDALPEIGHACGHNLIAMMSIGAFLGVAEAIKAFKVPGRVRLIGTPAEEGLGGKLKLIDAGAFKDVDACLMTHPGPEDTVPGFSGDAYMPTLANHKFTVRYTGKPAHASMSPWHGLNALDAVVLAYNGVSALRQQMRPDERIHGVITQGGTRPNIITAHASLDYYIRSPTLKSADELMQRAKRCFDGAALQTGCSVEYEIINTYADVRPNKTIATLYAESVEEVGSKVKCDLNAGPVPGSTDQGNVCYECPAFHAYVGIHTDKGVNNHTPGFTAHGKTRDAHEKCLVAAKGMAIAGWKIISNDEAGANVRKDFEDDKKIRSAPAEYTISSSAGFC